ncbi:MAG: hypothetical protein B7Y02_10960 [Rhodobacterales bacterium 17-64-5]|nr:MAG: hypothetical protein B7Y02_10960 [Rhodobacterales bacterium 17-64-5]
MPYRWSDTQPHSLTLWPHRSLTPRGRVAFVGLTAGLFLVPLLMELGHPTLWVLLPFIGAALGGIWWALDRNARDRAITEALILQPDRIALTRTGPRARTQTWEANPHWVRLTLHATAGPVPNYLTLTGAGREVELGAFLTEGERIALKSELEARLAQIH